MTQLFVQLTSSVTGNVITIVALELVAAIIGFIIAWYYAKSIYTPVIKGLETDKANLNNQVAKSQDNIKFINAKIETLNDKASKLTEDLDTKNNELLGLSVKQSPVGKYIISIAKNGEYYFNLKATNGQTILTSEMYSSKAACTNGIDSVMNNCNDNTKYDRKRSSNDKPYFNLKAANGQIIGKSEMYESEAGMENGIASVKRNGISTNIVEDDD